MHTVNTKIWVIFHFVRFLVFFFTSLSSSKRLKSRMGMTRGAKQHDDDNHSDFHVDCTFYSCVSPTPLVICFARF